MRPVQIVDFLHKLGVKVSNGAAATLVSGKVGLVQPGSKSSLFHDGKCLKYVDYSTKQFHGTEEKFYNGEVCVSGLL